VVIRGINLKCPSVKLDSLRKLAIRSRNKRTIYNVYKLFKDISEQPGLSSNINIHTTWLKKGRYQANFLVAL
jgi:hypothetical protein